MRYLTAIAIGPVQDFIAAARRCRDLWFGSRLLSELSKSAALVLFDKGELIFPAADIREDLAEDSPLTVANKILARVEVENISLLIQDVKHEVRQRLMRAAELRSMRLRERGLVVKEGRYWEQLRDFVEFYAAWVPEGDYKESRSRVEEMLAARKALRDFPAYEGGEGEYKSSLDGAREHVIQKRSPRLWESNLKENEYLDAIGIVKRFGGGQPRFDSTVDLAAVPFIEGIKKSSDRRREAFRRYERFTRDHRLPPRTYSLLYEHESRQIFEEDEAASDDLKKIREALGKPNPPYYALLLGDGDRMGGAISGLARAEDHRKFSSALSGFAGKARTLIDERYEGCSIYCGGDDVLALLPLHKALECARAVRDLFRDCMINYDVTFSAGLVIAHGLEPLTEVREWGLEAERTAKNIPGKDAICVAVHPRSGSPVTIGGKWDELCGLLDEIARLYDEIPRGFGYEMRDLAERLEEWDEISSSLKDLVLAAAKKKECTQAVLELIQRQAKDRGSIEQFYRSLMVTRWFARAEREAQGDSANSRN